MQLLATAGAMINVAVNIIVIPQIGVLGACVSSLAAECVVFMIAFVKSKDYLDIKGILKDNVIPLIRLDYYAFCCIAISTHKYECHGTSVHGSFNRRDVLFCLHADK